MNIKNEKAVINDENLESVTGGTTPELPATELGEITIGDICGAITSKADTGDEKETTSQKVGIIPGLPAFP